jgi:outer membrane autotransporter protein
MAAGSTGQSGAVWGQVLLNAAKRDNAHGASPYRANSYGLMVGADLLQTPTLVAGGALSWVNSIAEGRAELSGSHARLNSYQATGYFTWKPEHPRTIGLTIDGQLGIAYNDYNQQRQIDFIGQRANAAFGGQQYLLYLRAGYTVPVGETASITPYVGLREVHLRNAAYSEKGADSANLKVNRLVMDWMSHEIGLQGLAVFDTASGFLVPSLKVGWVHSYTNDLIPMSAELGDNAFTSTSTRGGHDGVTLGTGLSYMSSDRVRLGLQYDGELRKDFQKHSAIIKFNYSF